MSAPNELDLDALADIATQPAQEWLDDDSWSDYDYRSPPLKIVGSRKIKYKFIGKIPPRTLRDYEWESDI